MAFPLREKSTMDPRIEINGFLKNDLYYFLSRCTHTAKGARRRTKPQQSRQTRRTGFKMSDLSQVTLSLNAATKSPIRIASAFLATFKGHSGMVMQRVSQSRAPSMTGPPVEIHLRNVDHKSPFHLVRRIPRNTWKTVTWNGTTSCH